MPVGKVERLVCFVEVAIGHAMGYIDQCLKRLLSFQLKQLLKILCFRACVGCIGCLYCG